jgi:hypothetical protein
MFATMTLRAETKRGQERRGEETEKADVHNFRTVGASTSAESEKLRASLGGPVNSVEYAYLDPPGGRGGARRGAERRGDSGEEDM